MVVNKNFTAVLRFFGNEVKSSKKRGLAKVRLLKRYSLKYKQYL